MSNNNTKMTDFLVYLKKLHLKLPNQIQRNFIGNFLAWPLTKNKAVRLTLSSNNKMVDFLFYIHRDIWNIIFI